MQGFRFSLLMSEKITPETGRDRDYAIVNFRTIIINKVKGGLFSQTAFAFWV